MFSSASNIVIAGGSFNVAGTPQVSAPPRQVTPGFVLPDESRRISERLGIGYTFQAPTNSYL